MKRTLTTLLGGAAALALLVGCGSDDSDNVSSTSSATESTPPAPLVYETPTDLVIDLVEREGGVNCYDFNDTSKRPVEQISTCKVDLQDGTSTRVSIYMYPTVEKASEALGTWHDASRTALMNSSWDLVGGGNWTIRCEAFPSNTVCETIHKALGGTYIAYDGPLG